jgi:glucose-1-phosphate thymidylyltransferase
MDCIILCAGYATRLRPLTENTPKPLLEVAGRPILEHILDRLALTSVKRVFIATNARFADHFSRWAGRMKYPGLDLNVVNDGTTTNEDRLGSMGDVRFVARQYGLADDFLIINGDNLFTFSLKPLLADFYRRGNTLALYDVGSREVAKLYGIPTLTEDHRVIGFVEKPKEPTSTLASIGIYAYQGKVHKLLDEYLNSGFSPDKTGEFVAWVHEKADVFGHAYGGANDVWFDIGTLDQLKEAGERWTALESQPHADAAAAGKAIEAAITKMKSAGAAPKCAAASAPPATYSFAFLVKHLVAADPKARLFAARVFGEVRSPAAISWLLDLLDDRRIVNGTSVSAAAAGALVGLGYAASPAAVLEKAKAQGFVT